MTRHFQLDAWLHFDFGRIFESLNDRLWLKLARSHHIYAPSLRRGRQVIAQKIQSHRLHSVITERYKNNKNQQLKNKNQHSNGAFNTNKKRCFI